MLLFELALTRVIAVYLFYHYTFLVMSGAVLGLGLGGLFTLRWGRTSLPASEALTSTAVLGTAAALAGLAAVALFRYGLPIPHPLLYLPLALLPFVPAGMALALMFDRFALHSGWLYAADLCGAAAGALLAVPVLNRLGGVGAALAAVVLLGVAAAVFAWGSGRRLARGAAIVGSLFAAAVLVYTMSNTGFDIDVQDIRLKAISGQMHEGDNQGKPVYSEWDAFARTDVMEYPDAPDQMAVFLDGSSASALRRYPRSSKEKALLQSTLGYLPFHSGPNRRVLAIGPGGGEDVLLALLAGSERITAVEINPGTVRSVRHFGTFSGDIYDRPEVEVVVDEGRSFLRRSNEQYDLIYLSKTVTQAAGRTGYALVENYLYTVEAFDDYLDHLAPDGRLAFILHDEYDLTRAFTTALAALVNRGESPAEASRHLVLINDRAPEPGAVWYPLLMLKSSPFTQKELDKLLAGAVTGGFDPLFMPGVREEFPYSLFSQDNVSLDAFAARVEGMEVTPTTDDRPFFYALKQRVPGSLLFVATIALAIVVLAVLWPAKTRRSGTGWSSTVEALYFAALGVGFMVVEVAIMQRFGLLLGYPTLSVTVTLATLLVAGGIGGWLSQRVPDDSLSATIAGAALGVSLLLVGYVRFTPWLANRFLFAALPVRIAIAVATVTPLGLAMGVPFPAGLRRLRARLGSDEGNRSVAWVWGINGLASILGSTIGIAVAMLGGFSWSLLLGSLIYLGVYAGSALYARPARDGHPRVTPQPSPAGTRPGP
jgi:predicted membrane-bound spermidine synthase